MTDQDDIKKIMLKIGKKKKQKKQIPFKLIGMFLVLALVFMGIYQVTSKTIKDVNEIAEEGFNKTEVIKELHNIPEKPQQDEKMYIKTAEPIKQIDPQNNTKRVQRQPRDPETPTKPAKKSQFGFKIQQIEDPNTGLVLEKVIPDEQ